MSEAREQRGYLSQRNVIWRQWSETRVQGEGITTE